VILCPPHTVGGVDQRGGAPGTRETDLLRPMHLVQHVDALVLSGGSAFGLAAADGVMNWLAERGTGYQAGEFVVPIVPAAIIFDLPLGAPGIYPDAAMGRAACDAASADPVAHGSVGAGTGARVGGMLGNDFATKGGLGSYALAFDNGLVVAALAVVNAAGDVLDEHGEILAGVRTAPDSNTFMGMLNVLRAQTAAPPMSNTVIGVVTTNARLNKEQANKVAQMAHDGLARAVNPAHTLFDGDTIFALATGEIEADPTLVGAFGAEAFAAAIRRGVRAARTLGGVRAYND
jgi:L-aminopeptidase/D-esterase-like protein